MDERLTSVRNLWTSCAQPTIFRAPETSSEFLIDAASAALYVSSCPKQLNGRNAGPRKRARRNRGVAALRAGDTDAPETSVSDATETGTGDPGNRITALRSRDRRNRAGGRRSGTGGDEGFGLRPIGTEPASAGDGAEPPPGVAMRNHFDPLERKSEPVRRIRRKNHWGVQGVSRFAGPPDRPGHRKAKSTERLLGTFDLGGTRAAGGQRSNNRFRPATGRPQESLGSSCFRGSLSPVVLPGTPPGTPGE